jgi:ribosomal protein S18 acetylase RimI-like enzyme
MTPARFERYLARCLQDYVAEGMRATGTPYEEAMRRGRSQIEGLLPRGAETEGQHVSDLVDPSGKVLGQIWYAEAWGESPPGLFLYEIHVAPAARGRGVGGAAMRLLEDEALRLGAAAITLHVFTHNAGAIRLYERLGYEPTERGDGGMRMRKVVRLAESPPTFGRAPADADPRRRRAAYALIRDESGRVAVVRAPQGLFLPGGGAKDGETPEETVRREVREECGLEVAAPRRLGRAFEHLHARGEGDILNDASFFGATAAGPARPGLRDDDHLLGWMPPLVAVRALRPRSHAWAVARHAVAADIDPAAPTIVEPLAPTDMPACEAVLRALPDGFGIESALVAYVADLSRLPAWVARRGGAVVGFLALARESATDAAIHVMAVRPEHHGRGVGRALLAEVEARLWTAGTKTLHVRTLGPSHPSPHYARTRSVYRRWGFVPGEETDEWGPGNPCLRMAKPILAPPTGPAT